MTCLMLFLIFGSSTALIKVVKRALTGQTINCDGISEKVLYRQNIDISTTTNMSQKCRKNAQIKHFDVKVEQ